MNFQTFARWRGVYPVMSRRASVATTAGGRPVNTYGRRSEWAMKVTCDVSNLKQLKFQIFSIQGRENCKRYGRECSVYYTTNFEAS